MGDVGRNAPCPCGSGRKYKQCCLSKADTFEQASMQLRVAEATLVPPLLEFALDAYGRHLLEEGWQAFFEQAPEIPDLAPDDLHFESIFVPWFLFEFVGDPGRRRRRGLRVPASTVAATWMELFPQKLNAIQRAFGEASLQTALSFHIVRAVQPGRSIDLEDALTGGQCQVYERSASANVEPGGALLARVVAAEGGAIMFGCAPYQLPPLWRTHILDLRDRALQAYDTARLSADQVWEMAPEILALYHAAADALVNPRLPTLVNTDGEPVEPIDLHFTLRARPRAAFDRLKTLSLERDEEVLLQDARYDRKRELRAFSLDWAKRGNRQHKEWDNTILGHLEVDGSSLRANVNSRRRAARLRRQIEKRLGDGVTFKAQVHHSTERMLEDARRAGAGRATRADEDDPAAHSPEARAMVEEMMARHWEQWFDTKIPALGDLTPREAAATPAGRDRLDALLAEYAWKNESAPAHMRVDIDGLRRRLGLETGDRRTARPSPTS